MVRNTVDGRMAARLRAARLAAGFERAAHAVERHKLVYPTYLGHENASKGFYNDVAHYARIFNVSPKWLLTGEGQMTDPEDEIARVWRQIPPGERLEALNYLRYKAGLPQK